MIESRSARITFAASASLIGVLALGASPVTAGSTTTDVTDLYGQLVAPGDMAMFVNSPRDGDSSGRDAYCTDAIVEYEYAVRSWILAGFEGDPPPFPGYVAGSIPLKFKDVARGNIRASFSAQVPVELWEFEPGKTTDAAGAGACIDTDGLHDETRKPLAFKPTLFAKGMGTYSGKDNDRFGAGPRSNVFGDTVRATLTGPSGTTSLMFKYVVHTQGCTDDGCHIDTYKDHWTIQTR